MEQPNLMQQLVMGQQGGVDTGSLLARLNQMGVLDQGMIGKLTRQQRGSLMAQLGMGTGAAPTAVRSGTMGAERGTMGRTTPPPTTRDRWRTGLRFMAGLTQGEGPFGAAYGAMGQQDVNAYNRYLDTQIASARQAGDAKRLDRLMSARSGARFVPEARRPTISHRMMPTSDTEMALTRFEEGKDPLVVGDPVSRYKEAEGKKSMWRQVQTARKAIASMPPSMRQAIAQTNPTLWRYATTTFEEFETAARYQREMADLFGTVGAASGEPGDYSPVVEDILRDYIEQ
jgi:hypothetical protein